ncbi:hypothetical protein NDU88_002865 [Pleurodeles waltl]|uniref:Uncharacterized protein n=1 Tax=Pleurodeles waltl TaxID=8319 RepID=A0AAV7L4M4_PLEWA|nr:hypothetical protein NDU88_002865 [Pleurodeles waltl]
MPYCPRGTGDRVACGRARRRRLPRSTAGSAETRARGADWQRGPRRSGAGSSRIPAQTTAGRVILRAGVLWRPPGGLGAKILEPRGRVAARKSGRCPPARPTLAELVSGWALTRGPADIVGARVKATGTPVEVAVPGMLQGCRDEETGILRAGSAGLEAEGGQLGQALL